MRNLSNVYDSSSWGRVEDGIKRDKYCNREAEQVFKQDKIYNDVYFQYCFAGCKRHCL